jgi:hypothetical protein
MAISGIYGCSLGINGSLGIHDSPVIELLLGGSFILGGLSGILYSEF